MEPHHAFSLANERTFLSWIRTALAVLAGAILLHEIQGDLGPRWAVLGLSVALALLGGALGVGAWWRWRSNEQAMLQGRPLDRPAIVLVMAAAVLLVSLATACLIVLS
jgi:putative membrane protein